LKAGDTPLKIFDEANGGHS